MTIAQPYLERGPGLNLWPFALKADEAPVSEDGVVKIASAEETKDANLWIWSAEIVRPVGPVHLYTLLAPYAGTAAPLETRTVDLPEIKVAIHSGVLDADQATRVTDRLAEGWIDLSGLGLLTPATLIKARQTTISRVLGDAGAKIDGHYALPDLHTLLGPARTNWRPVFDLLREELDLSFDGDFINHIGNLDLVAFASGPNQPPQIELTFNTTAGVQVRRKGWMLAQDLWLHLLARRAGEVVADALYSLPKDQERVALPIQRGLDRYEAWVFPHAPADRAHHETQHFVRRIDLNMRALGGGMEIEDRLTNRAQSGGPELVERARSVAHYSPSASSVSGDDEALADRYHGLKQDWAAVSAPSDDRWFARGVSEELDVIAHLNDLLDGASVKRAILADPFFGPDAFSRLVTRLQSSGLDLTVVTSWTTTDADNAKPLDPTKSNAVGMNLRRLEALMARFGDVVSPRLKVRNVIRGAAEQAFHDRYLWLEHTDGRSSIYLLSNSINAMAAAWPFVMSRLSGAAAQEAETYVKNLALGRDSAADIQLAINFDWPPPR